LKALHHTFGQFGQPSDGEVGGSGDHTGKEGIEGELDQH
jgi:hypothetical protein